MLDSNDSDIPNVVELSTSQNSIENYLDIWSKWNGRKPAKFFLLLDLLTCWSLLLVDEVWYYKIAIALIMYVPLIYYFFIIPWNLTVYQSKYCCCHNYKKIVQDFDQALNDYISIRNPLNNYNMLRHYRYLSLICVFCRILWSVSYYDTLVPNNTTGYLILYLIVSIQPIIQSVFIWQFCNNIARDYIERGLQGN